MPLSVISNIMLFNIYYGLAVRLYLTIANKGVERVKDEKDRICQ